MNIYTVRGVLKARILKWFAIPFASGHVLSFCLFESDKTGL